MAGEYLRAALDQHLTYRQLKTLARNSLEHAFLPGASLWTTIGAAGRRVRCDGHDGDRRPAECDCAAYLATSERAAMQWELERRFLAFESQQ